MAVVSSIQGREATDKSVVYKGKTITWDPDRPEEAKIPADELHEHLFAPTTERSQKTKARCRWKHAAAGEFVEKGVKAGIERMRLVTESHKQTAGLPEVIRRAKQLEAIMLKGTVVLQQDEFIIGYHAEDPNMFPLYPELSYMNVKDYLQSDYAPQPVAEAEEINNYWKPHSLQAKCERYFEPIELLRMYQVSTIEAPCFAHGYNSIIPPYETILQDGLLKRIELAEDHIREARKELTREPWDGSKMCSWLPKIDNWEAMVIADKAVIAWAKRHARLCKIVAENFEADPARREELLEIARCPARAGRACQGIEGCVPVEVVHLSDLPRD